MLRALLLGLLSVTAVASCKKSEGTAASAVGVSAGKVLEVKGTVTVKHGDATKPLAQNDTVEADDTVITGADGSVAIELSHNLVRWELGPNKQQKVRESIAFKAAKNTAPTANVEQDTAAAGRPAERSAVGTTVTAVEDEAKEDKAEAPPPPPAAEAAPAPAPGASADEGAAPEKKAAPSRRHSSRHRESAAKEDAVALPSADEAMGGRADDAPHEETTRATRGATRGPMVTAKAAAPTAPMAPPPMAAASATASASGGGGGGGDAAAASLIAGKQSALKACLAGHADPVTLTVTVTGGHATVKLASKSAVSASLDACVKKVVGSLSFSGNAHASTTIKP